MLGESIQVTVLSDGVAFLNVDAARRLRELGVKRKGAGKIVSYRLSVLQAQYLKGYPAIRDLDHYRELVGDPRSNGLMVHFIHGKTLTMERVKHPYRKAEWYAILDTAIGCDAEFLKQMQARGRVRIERLQEN